MSNYPYAQVLLMYETKTLDKVFTYKIPSFLLSKINIGTKVKIPFGTKNINGIVLDLKKEYDDSYALKEIIEIINEDITFSSEMIEVAKKLQNLTLCSLSTAFKTMVPSRLKASSDKKSLAKYDYEIILKDKDTAKDFISKEKKAKKQVEIIAKLLQNDKLYTSAYSKTIIEELEKKHLITLNQISKYRLNKTSEIITKVSLTPNQEKVLNEIVPYLREYKTHLIYGVTGSGKTEIYFSLIDEVLKNNKTALVLVPEITLSTQLIKRFQNRFGNIVGIYHSSLSDGEKYDEYLKAYRGDVKIVIGTRSSVFTPLDNLGIIIIDEEHSDNFKQDTTPRYNAIDIAHFRAKYHKIPLILGSATPSFESMAKALNNIYMLHTLPTRVGSSKLPNISLVDMALEYRHKNPLISELLKESITKCLHNHEQSIILLNRKGYSPFISCHSCGFVYKCKYCDISLTYHKSSNSLRCHYCGYTVLKSDNCPSCHEDTLSYLGLGTEKLEEVLKEMYPKARIIRMDADTTTKKGSNEKIIESFKNYEYDILIGTQMISKGLDFPLVTLVGVLNADASLNIPDFRSSERTFSLLTQVSGRAGRSNKEGNVIIQTFNPDNYIFNCVKNNDYDNFYQEEINIRKKLRYPPYYFIASLKIASKEYDLASKEATKIKKYLEDNLNNEVIILGPTTASVFKLKNIYRFQIILKYQKSSHIYKVLQDLDNLMKLNNKVFLEIDINPLKV